MVDSHSAVRAAIAGELRLLDPAVRSSAEHLAELLDPEFSEIGASGRWWSRSAIIAALAADSRPSDEPIRVSEMRGALLAPDTVHLTYVSDSPMSDDAVRRVRRSSVWRRSERGWRLYFHQGTPSSH
ncbi:DUF4440 domain-containing protein [Nocardia sp. R6R-6]|uniref:DUF4440 domain-containing protein n=1 Tax=Nocardia sp. R6R-6 TaxID=3459303 RepID=UPI00403DD553